jgi:hypothetical protein
MHISLATTIPEAATLSDVTTAWDIRVPACSRYPTTSSQTDR